MSSQTGPRAFKISALAPPPGSAQRTEPSPSSSGHMTLLRLQLFGHYSLADGSLFACKTLQIYPHQIALSCEVAGKVGDAVKLDLDLLGSLKGVIEGRMAAGMRVDIVDMYQDHIAEKLTWFKSCVTEDTGQAGGTPAPRTRAAERIVPRQITCRFIPPDGEPQSATILNISRSGAALKSTHVPPVGASIILGDHLQRRGLIVRHLDGGFAIAFLIPVLAHDFGPNMTI